MPNKIPVDLINRALKSCLWDPQVVTAATLSLQSSPPTDIRMMFFGKHGFDAFVTIEDTSGTYHATYKARQEYGFQLVFIGQSGQESIIEASESRFVITELPNEPFTLEFQVVD